MLKCLIKWLNSNSLVRKLCKLIEAGMSNSENGLMRNWASSWTKAANQKRASTKTGAVTAEAAGSSPVVPAIHSKAVKSDWH
jgi:hypothetical protein